MIESNGSLYILSSGISDEEIQSMTKEVSLDNIIEDETQSDDSNKNKRFYITLTPNLNMATIRTLHVSKYPVPLGILYNKNSNIVQFQIDTELNPIKNKIIHVTMFRKLEDSIFKTMFLKMDRIQDGNTDFKYNLVGIRPIFANRIIQILNEKLDISFNLKKSEDKRNEIELIAWKLQDIDNDLLFLLVQRKFFNKVSRIFTIRSYALQISTDRGENVLKRYYEEFERMKGKNKVLDLDIAE